MYSIEVKDVDLAPEPPLEASLVEGNLADLDENGEEPWGCAGCGSNHDEANVLVCDGCEEEWHIYCLSPPLSSVPKSSEWHCEKCVAYRERTPRPRGRPPGPGSASRAKADEKTKQVRSYVVAEPTLLDPNTLENTIKPRGRGRPKGSSKKNRDTIAVASLSSHPGPSSAYLSSGTMKMSDTMANNEYYGESPKDMSCQAKDQAKAQIDAVGIEAALAVIARAGRGLTPQELDLLKQLRVWGPYSDISTARDAALQQRDVLKRKLSSISQ